MQHETHKVHHQMTTYQVYECIHELGYRSLKRLQQQAMLLAALTLNLVVSYCLR